MVKAPNIGLLAIALLAACAFGDCSPDPDKNLPTEAPPNGCTWAYRNQITYDQTHILSSSSILMTSDWETLTPCACGWYPATVPCPQCPSDVDTRTTTDTLTWTATYTSAGTHAVAIGLKLAEIFSVGYTYTLTTTEQNALSGTHTETSTYTLNRTKILCFERYYRVYWHDRARAAQLKRVTVYFWSPDCGGQINTNVLVNSSCTDLLAECALFWSGFKNVEFAPQQPPCGGVAIQVPDPWGGIREKPCCETVCNPPPAPKHPCCGCAVVQ